MTTTEDLARKYFDAWEARDPEAIRPLLASGATFNGPMGTAGNADECIDGMRRLFGGTAKVDVKLRLAEGDDVMTWFELTMQGSDTPLPTCNWSHAENGLITEIKVAFDPRPILPPAS